MKIKSVDVMRLVLSKINFTTSRLHPTVVRINTDEGISGYGEIGLSYGAAEHASFGMAKDFAKLIIGMNPMNNEEVWEKIFRKTFWGMGGGTVIFGGISGIDIALWDIKAKMLGVPIYQLLGGKTNTKLRTYASQIQFDWAKDGVNLVYPEQYAEATRKAMAEGYNCVKVDPVGMNMKGEWMGWNCYGLLQYEQLKIAIDRVAAIREAGGPNMDIIIELHSLTDTNSAIQLGRELEQFRCFYYEEPTHPLNAESMKQIAHSVKIPMAAGERIYTRWGYRPFFENRSLHVIQPDLGNCGGFSEVKKICDMAHVYDVAVQVHVAGGPLATAAALHLESVIPNFLIHEHHAVAIQDATIALCKYDYQPKNGFYEVPDLPGLGQELSEEAIRKAITETVK